jgi:hypothetical protein
MDTKTSVVRKKTERASYARKHESCRTGLGNTPLSVGTIVKTLKKSKDKAKRDKPYIVLLKVPETWTRNQSVGETFRDAFAQSFHDTTRISAVLLHYELWSQINESSSSIMVGTRTEHNPRAVNPLTAFGKILSVESKDGEWHEVRDEQAWHSIPAVIGRPIFTRLSRKPNVR